jgi:Flp pilus assembly protein TadG
MKITDPRIKPSSKAQTMVEFALVLPILLMLIYGVIEVGRLAFIYSTIATASREAARYGSASGAINTTTKRFADCAGMRAAAQKVDFLDVIEDANIIITVAGNNCPIGGTGPNSVNKGDTITVTVSGAFIPLAGIVPLTARTLTSRDTRTLMGIVQIKVPTATNGPAGTPIPTLTATLTSIPIIPTNTQPPPLPSATPECVVTSAVPVISGNYSSISWQVNNMNAFAIVVKEIYVSWPAGSGTLTTVTIDGTPFSINALPPTKLITSISYSLSPGLHTIIFYFQNNPLSGAFTVSVAFSHPGCSTLQKMVTVYPVTHSGAFPSSVGNSKDAGPWILNNHTNTALYISYLSVYWDDGGVDCKKNDDLDSARLLVNNTSYWNWVLGHNWSSCHSPYIATAPSSLTLPPGISVLNLTFAMNGNTHIKVIMGLNCYAGNYVCQDVDSSNVFQITPP